MSPGDELCASTASRAKDAVRCHVEMARKGGYEHGSGHKRQCRIEGEACQVSEPKCRRIGRTSCPVTRLKYTASSAWCNACGARIELRGGGVLRLWREQGGLEAVLPGRFMIALGGACYWTRESVLRLWRNIWRSYAAVVWFRFVRCVSY